VVPLLRTPCDPSAPATAEPAPLAPAFDPEPFDPEFWAPESLSFLFLLLSCSWDIFAFADASALAEAAGVCALWLVLAPALAWPGVTEALPDAEPLADVCATAPAARIHAAVMAIQNLFIDSFPFVFLSNSKTGGYEAGSIWISDAIFWKNV
jgi:hypothetical protein